MGKEPKRVPGEHRGLGFFSTIVVFMLLCCLALAFLVGSISASKRPVGTIVDVDTLIQTLAELGDTHSKNPAHDGWDVGQLDDGNDDSQKDADDDQDTSGNSDASEGSQDKTDEDQDAGQASDESAGKDEEPSINEAELQKGYYYNLLSDDEKHEYALIYQMIATRSKVELPSTDTEEIDRIFRLVKGDRPEFFFIGSYSYTPSSASTTMKGNCSFSESEITELTRSVDAVVDACISGIPAGADDYAKAKYVYEFLIENTTYSHEVVHNMNSLLYVDACQNAESALVDKTSVCAGYARAYQLIMQRLGFTCAHVEGVVTRDDGRHAWCLIQLDGDYYYVDPTWGDHDSDMMNENVRSWSWPNYGYLCVSTEDMNRSRVADSYQQLPNCTATADNYYVRENRILLTPDLNEIARWGDEARANGDDHFQFRCADQATFDQILNSLQSIPVPFDTDSQYYYSYHDDVLVFEFLFC